MYQPIEESIANSPRPRITDYFSQGFNIVFKAPGAFILAIVLFFVANIILSFVPGGGMAFSFFLQPLLMVGFFIMADKINYQEPVAITNFFDGFRSKMDGILVANLLMVLVLFIPITIAVLGIVLMLGMDFLMAAFTTDPEELINAGYLPSFSAGG